MLNFKTKLSLALYLLPLSYANLAATQFDLGNPQSPPLLLAKNFVPDANLSEFLISEKLDGIRAYWNGSQLLTRIGRTINAPLWFTEGLPNQPLDGELWLGRALFEKLSSVVRKQVPIDEEWYQVKYMVFDLPQDLSAFEVRYEKLQKLITKSPNRNLQLVPQINISSPQELTEELSSVIAKSGEGLMLHRKNSLYQAKRSYDLQKLKPFEDAEARVIAHLEGKGKYQGMMGAIEVINQEGKKFRIGSGFSLQERRNPPQINCRITYRYRGKTKNNIPRFATYLRQREED